MEAGIIVWSIKRLPGYLWDTNVRLVLDHKALEIIDKIADYNTRRTTTLSNIANVVATGAPTSSRGVPLPPTERDRSGPRMV